MRIRDLIEQLGDIARRGGDQLDVVVRIYGFCDDDGEWRDGCDKDILDVRYAGGPNVELS